MVRNFLHYPAYVNMYLGGELDVSDDELPSFVDRIKRYGSFKNREELSRKLLFIICGRSPEDIDENVMRGLQEEINTDFNLNQCGDIRITLKNIRDFNKYITKCNKEGVTDSEIEGVTTYFSGKSEKEMRKWYRYLRTTEAHENRNGHDMWVEKNVLIVKNLNNGIITKYDEYGALLKQR
ncbi:hypothetical protein [Liquorilactobacillus hordei]|uniref:hypothetical protein n=1 Tax=Liquorilactobacillus hordei TaxID=468911 RepID=UPI0039EB3EE9